MVLPILPAATPSMITSGDSFSFSATSAICVSRFLFWPPPSVSYSSLILSPFRTSLFLIPISIFRINNKSACSGRGRFQKFSAVCGQILKNLFAPYHSVSCQVPRVRFYLLNLRFPCKDRISLLFQYTSVFMDAVLFRTGLRTSGYDLYFIAASIVPSSISHRRIRCRLRNSPYFRNKKLRPLRPEFCAESLRRSYDSFINSASKIRFYDCSYFALLIAL